MDTVVGFGTRFGQFQNRFFFSLSLANSIRMLGILLCVFCFVHVKPVKQVLGMSLEIISPFRSFAQPISSGKYRNIKRVDFLSCANEFDRMWK